MDYSIRLMKDDEIAFAYTQRKDIMQESGCIGHLRVDVRYRKYRSQEDDC